MSKILYVDNWRTVEEACEIFKVSKTFIYRLAKEEGVEVKDVNGAESVDVFQLLKATFLQMEKSGMVGRACRIFVGFMLWGEKDGRTVDELTDGFYSHYIRYVGQKYFGAPNLSVGDAKHYVSTALRRMRRKKEAIKTFRRSDGGRKVVWLRREYASEADLKLDRVYGGKRYLFSIADGEVVCTKYLYRDVKEKEVEDLLKIADYIRNLVADVTKKVTY